MRALSLSTEMPSRLAAVEDIAAGRLVPVLEDCNPGDMEEVHAVYVGQGGYPPLRVRAFLDFLDEKVESASTRHSSAEGGTP